MRPIALATRGIMSYRVPLSLVTRGILDILFPPTTSPFVPFFLVSPPPARKQVVLSLTKAPLLNKTTQAPLVSSPNLFLSAPSIPGSFIANVIIITLQVTPTGQKVHDKRVVLSKHQEPQIIKNPLPRTTT
jgi:hypothetical protein